jgi:hypothetical protein
MLSSFVLKFISHISSIDIYKFLPLSQIGLPWLSRRFIGLSIGASIARIISTVLWLKLYFALLIISSKGLSLWEYLLLGQGAEISVHIVWRRTVFLWVKSILLFPPYIVLLFAPKGISAVCVWLAEWGEVFNSMARSSICCWWRQSIHERGILHAFTSPNESPMNHQGTYALLLGFQRGIL